MSPAATAVPPNAVLRPTLFPEGVEEDLAPRRCLREPISEIEDAARFLNEAVSAHLQGNVKQAAMLIRRADTQAVRDWSESIMGKASPYLKQRPVAYPLPKLPKERRVPVRMPTAKEVQFLHERDGFRCRFCGIPVIRKAVRLRIRAKYPDELQWGKRNIQRHPAFLALWAQYDHLLPHSRGGSNELTNVVVTCAPCNFGRMDLTLDEVGLYNPLTLERHTSAWDGLERFR